MMARNFVQENASFFLPEIDIAGEHEGVIASELPVLQYIMSIFYRLFGFSHWIGRLINLIFSLGGVFCFSESLKIVSRNKQLTFYTGLVLLFSLWFSFARKSMPDTFSVSMAMMAVYGLTLFLYRDRPWGLLVFGLAAALSMLSKIPAALVLSPAILFLFSSKISVNKKIWMTAVGALALLPVLYWYGYMVPLLVAKYKFELFFPRSLKQGVEEIWTFRKQAVDKLIFKGFSSYVLSIMSFLGLWIALWKRTKVAAGIFICVVPVFAFYAIKTGLVWATHSYYMVPLVPFMAISIAYLMVKYRSASWLKLFLFIGIVESIAFQWNDYFIRNEKKYMLQLESECNQFSDRNAKVICNGTPNPQLMYFMNRRGWSLDAPELTDHSRIDQLMSYKPGWLIIDRHRPNADQVWNAWRNYGTPVYTSENIMALKLTSGN
jgi:4-amino-4-deoxy-L-arabinose transferase-like glycosyltransferase